MEHKVQRGDIYLTDLSGNVGSEQSGLRPVVIIQNNIGNNRAPTTVVAPLTSKFKPFLPTHTSLSPNDCGIRQPSTVLCEQIRVVDKVRLIKWLGKIENREKLAEINASILISLGIGG